MASSTFKIGDRVLQLDVEAMHAGQRGRVVLDKRPLSVPNRVWVQWDNDGRVTHTSADLLRRCDGLLDV